MSITIEIDEAVWRAAEQATDEHADFLRRLAERRGADVDIEHDTPDDVAGGDYGQDRHFMMRPRQAVG